MMRAVVAGLGGRDGGEGSEVLARAARGAADVAAVNNGSPGAAFIRRRLAEIRAGR